MAKKYGTKNVKKGNDRTFRKYGTVLPYQVRIRVGALYDK